MEVLSLAFFAMLIGIRHGFDGDHVAAISDMVGAEKEKKKQITYGVSYAFGHGGVVFLIGLATMFLGVNLPNSFAYVMEVLVAITLLLLGGYIFFSMLKSKKDYQFKGLISIVNKQLSKLLKKEHSPILFGLVGALSVGMIHGIGVESPTQILILSNAAGIGNFVLAISQLTLFVAGILVSTICITLAVSYGFMKAQVKRRIYFFIGSVTGVYSVALGTMMMIDLF
jgi:high-affinity nickel permease